MKAAWKEYLAEKDTFKLFVGTCCLLLIVLFAFLNFLSFNEGRSGYPFNDPLLNVFQARDLSIITFILTYGLALAGLFISRKHPDLICALFGAYAIMTIVRMCCLYLVPLDPPVGIIPLSDVFLKFSFYSGRDNLRDLFFSGHTATLFLFVFIFREKFKKMIFATGASILGLLLVIQHVHYSIDVIAAPFFAFLSVGLFRFLVRQLQASAVIKS
ncbi:MAG: hypothetical protein K0Q95_3271 [Bacteroidota bacterium]|jgi:hypothetical protein|nr:hypothetical protein [Bacteroidota bacterium]